MQGEQLRSLQVGLQRGCLQHGSHLGFAHGAHFFGAHGLHSFLGAQDLPQSLPAVNQLHGSQKQSQKLLQPAKLNAPTINRAAKAVFKCFI
ncbi:MAG: hypothetical protein S4CHLAM81_12000 [Chlamydiales bacterium]|nr:hypothetical protein [Chlamydiales bacterium]MCH9635976.1 hypothetical protein [Chlamydiales bacterium]